MSRERRTDKYLADIGGYQYKVRDKVTGRSNSGIMRHVPSKRKTSFKAVDRGSPHIAPIASNYRGDLKAPIMYRRPGKQERHEQALRNVSASAVVGYVAGRGVQDGVRVLQGRDPHYRITPELFRQQLLDPRNQAVTRKRNPRVVAAKNVIRSMDFKRAAREGARARVVPLAAAAGLGGVAALRERRRKRFIASYQPTKTRPIVRVKQ